MNGHGSIRISIPPAPPERRYRHLDRDRAGARTARRPPGLGLRLFAGPPIVYRPGDGPPRHTNGDDRAAAAVRRAPMALARPTAAAAPTVRCERADRTLPDRLRHAAAPPQLDDPPDRHVSGSVCYGRRERVRI